MEHKDSIDQVAFELKRLNNLLQEILGTFQEMKEDIHRISLSTEDVSEKLGTG
jgi:hypothetical protein